MSRAGRDNQYFGKVSLCAYTGCLLTKQTDYNIICCSHKHALLAYIKEKEKGKENNDKQTPSCGIVCSDWEKYINILAVVLLASILIQYNLLYLNQFCIL